METLTAETKTVSETTQEVLTRDEAWIKLKAFYNVKTDRELAFALGINPSDLPKIADGRQSLGLKRVERILFASPSSADVVLALLVPFLGKSIPQDKIQRISKQLSQHELLAVTPSARSDTMSRRVVAQVLMRYFRVATNKELGRKMHKKGITLQRVFNNKQNLTKKEVSQLCQEYPDMAPFFRELLPQKGDKLSRMIVMSEKVVASSHFEICRVSNDLELFLPVRGNTSARVVGVFVTEERDEAFALRYPFGESYRLRKKVGDRVLTVRTVNPDTVSMKITYGSAIAINIFLRHQEEGSKRFLVVNVD